MNLKIQTTLILLFPLLAIALDNTEGDWVVDEKHICNGYYSPIEIAEPNDDELVITAQSANMDFKNSSEFSDDVLIEGKNKKIFSDHAIAYHKDNNKISRVVVSNNVKFISKDIKILSDFIDYDINSDIKKFKNVKYVYFPMHARGVSRDSLLKGEHELIANDVTYTTCQPNNNIWHIKSKKTKFDFDEGLAKSKSTTLYIKNNPIFYWPYIEYPLDKRRRSGFLFPNLNQSNTDGFSIGIPYYHNLAPNYDMLSSVTYMSNRGYLLGGNFRFLTKHLQGILHISYINSDSEYNRLRSSLLGRDSYLNDSSTISKKRISSVRYSNDRYNLVTNGIYQDENQVINYSLNKYSDSNFSSDFVQSHFNLGIDNKLFARYSHQLNIPIGILFLDIDKYNNNLSIDGYDYNPSLHKIPEIYFNSDSLYFTNNLSINFNFMFSKFKADNFDLINSSLSDGNRYIAEQELHYNVTSTSVFANHSLKLRSSHYDSIRVGSGVPNQEMISKSTTRSIPILNLNYGMYIDSKEPVINNLNHTIIPRISYLYVPYKDQSQTVNFDSSPLIFDYYQLYRDNRYSGHDKQSDANRLTLAVENKLTDSTARVIISSGIGMYYQFTQSKYILNEEKFDTKKFSPLAFYLDYFINNQSTLNINLVKDKKTLDTFSSNLNYVGDNNNIINFTYQYLRNSSVYNAVNPYQGHMHQLLTSFSCKLSNGLNLIGKFDYDLRFSRSLNTMIGVDYGSCCTFLRIMAEKVWSPTSDNVNNYHFRYGFFFAFNGLGGVGNAHNKLISGLIPGYHRSNRNQV